MRGAGHGLGVVAVLAAIVGCRRPGPAVAAGSGDSGAVVAAVPASGDGSAGGVSKCPDHEDAWSAALPIDFVVSVQNDCRIATSVYPPSFRTPDQISSYLNALHAWSLELFGCPESGGDAAADDYGLMPATQRDRPFTSADTDLLTSHFLTALNVDLQKAGATALTPAQLEALRADLARRAARLPHLRPSAAYSAPSACPPDAGAPR